MEKNSSNGFQATSRQLVALVFVLALSVKTIFLPIFLIQETGRDAYVALAIDCAFDLVVLGLILAAIKISPDADFFTLMESAFGTVASRVLSAVFALFFFFKLAVSAAETLMFYTDSMVTDLSSTLLTIVLAVFLVAVAFRTLNSIARLNELMSILIVLCVTALIVTIVITGFDKGNILPFMQSPKEFGLALIEHASWTGDFVPLVLFIGRTKLKKHTAAFSAIAAAAGSVIAVFFALVMCAAFGNVRMLVDGNTNLAGIAQYTIGNVYGRADLFSSIFWNIASVIETALLFYAVCRCIEYTAGGGRAIIIYATAAALVAVQIFAMNDGMIFRLVATSYAASIATPVLSLAASVMVLICAVRNSKKGGKETGGNEHTEEKQTEVQGKERSDEAGAKEGNV